MTNDTPDGKKPIPVGGGYFSTVKKAKEAIKANSHANYEKLLKIIDMAASAGDFETAARYCWMIIEHTPADENGERMIEESASKPKQLEKGPGGPVIQIGVRVGGINEPAKELPAPTVIEVKPVE